MLSGKTIIVTGVGKGIGFDILKKCHTYGAFVYGITRSKKDLQKLKDLKNCEVIIGDVTNTNILNKVIQHAKKNKRSINGLVNNAGERQRLKFNDITRKKVLRIFEQNFFSVFYNMQIFSKYLKQKKLNGSIVNIGSIVGESGFSELAGYASSKSALAGLTKSFSVEMAKNNIRANLINPGFIKTSYYKSFRKNKKNIYNWTISRIPQKKWGEPEDVSHLVCFLLSDFSKYITGTSLNVDGGWLSS